MKDTGCFTEDGTGEGSLTGMSDTMSGTKAPSPSRMPVSIAYALERSTWWHFGRLAHDLRRQPPFAKRLTTTRFPPAIPD